MNRSDPIARLLLELNRLPGLGQRSAARLVHYLLRQAQEAAKSGFPAQAQDLAKALVEAVNTVRLCNNCQNFATADLCSVCQNQKRSVEQICVVETVADLRAIEQAGIYQGAYHVLHGALAPLDGIGPDHLKIKELLARLAHSQCQELILATNANVEGDATALYLARLLKPQGLKITRLASGLPLGAELEYLDQGTVSRAFLERRDF